MLKFVWTDSGQTIADTYNKILETVGSPDFWLGIIWVIFKIILIVIVGKVVVSVLSRAVRHMMIDRGRKGLTRVDTRRAQTIGKLVNNVVNYTVNFIVLLLVLSELGVELAPLLAGAGVLGLAIGFGAQSLVKDVITGFFIIFEDQFAVGDVIKTGGFEGTVEEIGLRVTRIKSWTGEVHIIPNGSITQVTNFSANNSICVVDVTVPYESDIDNAIKTIKEATYRVYKSSSVMVREPEVLGVQSVSPSAVVIRLIAECKPNTQQSVERLLKAEIKRALDVAYQGG